MVYAINYLPDNNFVCLAIKCFVKLLEFLWARFVLLSLLICVYTVMNLRVWLSCKTRTRLKHSFVSLFKNNCRYLNCQQSTWSDMICIHYNGIWHIATCNNTTWSDMRGIHYNVMWPLRTWNNTTWSDR